MGEYKLPEVLKKTIDGKNVTVKAIGKLQANGEQVIGEWEQDINGWHVCTNCHMQYRGMPTIDRNPRWQYCPTCGAKMVEAEND